MRILFTIPHYFRSNRQSIHDSERVASERVISLTRCLSALHQHLGHMAQGLPNGSRHFDYPPDEGLSSDLDVVVCTTGDDHLLASLPAGLCRQHFTNVQPGLLGNVCHEILRDGLGQFDFFCYLEDDMLLTDPLFFQKLTWFNSLTGDEALLQPNRFELTLKPRLQKVYVEGDIVDTTQSARFHDITLDQQITASLMGTELAFRRIDNPLADCFFINAAQMERWVAASNFPDHTHASPGPLESAATLGIMRSFKTYQPAAENAGFLEVEHLNPHYEMHARGEGEHPELASAIQNSGNTQPAPELRQRVDVLPQQQPYSRDSASQWGLHGLHYGCGGNLREGWLNTDIMCMTDAQGHSTAVGRLARLDERFYYLQHDSAQPVPFEDESFDWVYSEHFLEHLTLNEAIVCLKDAHRLLKPGGLLRLSTPDLRLYITGYLDKQGVFFKEHRKRLKALGLQHIPQRRAWMVNQIFQNWGHQWIYDLKELTFAVRRAGFDPARVVECSFRQGRVPEVCALDLPVRNDESIYVEIIR